MTDSGHELRENNEQIVKLISQLKKQRKEMNFLIEKQELEKGRIQNEIEKLSFKLTLLGKSLGQRLKARIDYDKTINEIEENYSSLVEESGKLLFSINKEVNQLEQIMDKKIGTQTEAGISDEPYSPDKAAKAPSDQEETDETTEESGNPFNDLQKFIEKQKETPKEPDSPPENEFSKDEHVPSKLSETVVVGKMTATYNIDSSIPDKPKAVEDPEVESFREAYGRQHSYQVPQGPKRSK